MPAVDDDEEIIKKYGGTVQASPAGDDEDALIAKYGGTVQGSAKTKPPQSGFDAAVEGWKAANPSVAAVPDLLTGAAKGAASTVFHGGDLIRRGLGMERVINRPEVQQGITPTNTTQKIGSGVEQAAEFAIPGKAIATGGKAIDAATKIPAARMLGKAVLEAMGAGTVAGAQTGDPKAAGEAALMAGGTSAAVQGVAPLVAKGAKKLGVGSYMSAMKPSTALDQDARAKLFQTAQLEGIPVSEGGLNAAGDKIDALQQQVNDAIKNAPQSQGISKFDVSKKLNDPYQNFATQATPQDDLAAISNKGNQFLEAHPNEFTPQEAQDVKTGTYSALRKKGAYGGESAAGDEAQKALARGLKEELQTRIPELQGLNAREGSIIQLEGALQKAVARIQNVNKIPLRSLIGAGIGVAGGGAHGGSLEAAGAGAGMAMLAYVLDDPWVKSRLAIAIGRGADALAQNPGAVARIAAPAAAYGVTPNGQQRITPPPQ